MELKLILSSSVNTEFNVTATAFSEQGLYALSEDHIKHHSSLVSTHIKSWSLSCVCGQVNLTSV